MANGTLIFLAEEHGAPEILFNRETNSGEPLGAIGFEAL